jgi:hypothetical protein
VISSLRSLQLGLPHITLLGFKMMFREEKPQDLKGEPIAGRNQTTIDFIDRKTFKANLKEFAVTLSRPK